MASLSPDSGLTVPASQSKFKFKALSTAAAPTTAPAPALDLSGLTSPTHFVSETTWLDSLLCSSSASSSSSTTLSSLDASLSTTLNLLNLATTDTAALVDRTIDEIARSIPRLAFDLGVLRENTAGLGLTLEGIRQRSGSVMAQDINENGEETAKGKGGEVKSVMEKLRILDLVKSRMEAARDVLREAESWSTLDSEVTALILESSYSKAATRLAEAARSMVVFQHTIEYEARRALMVSLQNQLEAALSASLVKAILARDVKGCKSFLSIFIQIEREEEFRAYYFGARRSKLGSGWTRARLLDCREDEIEDRLVVIEDDEGGESSEERKKSIIDTTPVKFSTFLVRFYADLISLLNEERTYIPAIFPSPATTFASFIQTTLEGLTPSLPSRLAGIQTYYNSTSLPELILAYKAAGEFSLLVEKIMVQFQESAPLRTPTPASATSSKQQQGLSKRPSVSKRKHSKSYSIGTANAIKEGHLSSGSEGHPNLVVKGWEMALFEPFLDWQVNYSELEKKYLGLEVAKLTKSGSNGNYGGVTGGMMSYLAKGEADRGARVLWESTSKILGLAEEAMNRSVVFTKGFASVETIAVIDDTLVEFMVARREELDRARKGGARVNASNGSSSTRQEDDLELEGLEYSTSDWGTFQFGLRLLEACRSISEKLVGFESKLKGQLTSVAASMKEFRQESSTALCYSSAGVTMGAITMLRQSKLNSIELAKLLDPLDATIPSTTNRIHLPRGRAAVIDLTRATQFFLHSTILAPLLNHLSDYSNLPTWSTPDSTNRVGGASGRGAFDLSIPTFSLSPSETISRVGEGLFNLPRLFEVYAEDTALGVSIETLPFVDTESLRSMLYPATSASTSIGPQRHHRRNSADPDFIPLSPSILSPSPTGPSPTSIPPPSAPPSPNHLSAETIISTWLSSLTLSLLSHITTNILPSISNLSKLGADQLATDLAYISNVARALDVESGEDLDNWREGMELGGHSREKDSEVEDPESEWREGMKTRREEGGVGLEIWTKIGKQRGWRLL